MPSTRSGTLNKSRKLTPLQLRRKVALMSAGLTAAEIARRAGVTRQAVTMVLLDQIRSERIETEIANSLGQPIEKLFPSRAA